MKYILESIHDVVNFNAATKSAMGRGAMQQAKYYKEHPKAFFNNEADKAAIKNHIANAGLNVHKTISGMTKTARKYEAKMNK